jgi:hypothetical protein
MDGYPISWDEKWDECGAGSAACPYFANEIEQYMQRCHRQFDPYNDEFSVREIRLVRTKLLTTRRFWLWEVIDREGLQWFAVVGSGEGPFGDRRTTNRWLYAQTNDDGESAEEFLDREIAQHP